MGTPISNTMSELYTVQRYLQYDTLLDKNMVHFDAWASTFGETTTSIELSPEGTGHKARTRFARFQNLPELMNMFGEVADVKTADTLDLPRPKAYYQTVVVKPTEIQKGMVKDLSRRAKAVRDKKVDKKKDNMLVITSDGRKIGLDQRLMNEMLSDDPNSKVNACMENVHRIWEETAPERLTQLLFCDFSTPNDNIWTLSKEQQKQISHLSDAEKRQVLEQHIMATAENYAKGIYPGGFNVYDDIKAKLILKGVPADEIAFIHHAETETQKKDLFAKVRSGKVRVMLGSTFKCGAGTNIQDRLIALHDIDCPWRPGDLAQRAGRIERQGNMNPEVNIFRYVTEGTFDAYLFQTIEKKQSFISQIMTSKSPVRSCDDVDEQELSYAEIKALATGNPLIIEKAKLDSDVGKLRMLKSEYQSQHYRLQDDLMINFPKRIEAIKGHIEGFKADAIRLENNTHRTEESISPMTIGDKTYTDRGEAGAALLEACKRINNTQIAKIGSYRGFDMIVTFDSYNNEFKCDMKGSMTHTTTLGSDPSGNITRINNAFDKIPQRLQASEAQLQTLYDQIENAKTELAKPFAFETELSEKSERLAELDVVLSMDMDESPDTEHEEQGDNTAVVAAKNGLPLLETPDTIGAKQKPSLLETLEKNAEKSKALFGDATSKDKTKDVSI